MSQKIIIVVIMVVLVYTFYVFINKMYYCGDSPFYLPNTHDCV